MPDVPEDCAYTENVLKLAPGVDFYSIASADEYVGQFTAWLKKTGHYLTLDREPVARALYNAGSLTPNGCEGAGICSAKSARTTLGLLVDAGLALLIKGHHRYTYITPR